MVIHMSIDAQSAKTLPLIVELDDSENPRISHSAAQYARYLQRNGNDSYETISKRVKAIGKLRDYYILVAKEKSLEFGSMKNLLEDFLHAVDIGSVLDWKSASSHEFGTVRTAVFEYLSFISEQSPDWKISDSEHRFIDDCRISYQSLKHAKSSLLFHTKKRSAKKRKGGKKHLSGLRQYKPFPPHLVDDLISETENIRDKLLFAMSAFGGRRISELLHLFLEDIHVAGRELEVSLRHPIEAPMSWRNVSGSSIRGTRRDYLKSKFNLTPRTEHGATSTKSGWKGINFDDLAALSSKMYFIRDAATKLTALHRQYIHGFLPRIPAGNHPYYYVAESGHPLKIKAAEKQFKLARSRLERKFGVSLNGYGIHSLRHYYGYYHADVLRTDLLLLRHYMGHLHILSTAIYSHISPGTAKKRLDEAERRRGVGDKNEGKSESDAEMPDRDVRQPDFATTEIRWDTAFGALNHKNLTRKLK